MNGQDQQGAERTMEPVVASSRWRELTDVIDRTSRECRLGLGHRREARRNIERHFVRGQDPTLLGSPFRSQPAYIYIYMRHRNDNVLCICEVKGTIRNCRMLRWKCVNVTRTGYGGRLAFRSSEGRFGPWPFHNFPFSLLSWIVFLAAVW